MAASGPRYRAAARPSVEAIEAELVREAELLSRSGRGRKSALEALGDGVRDHHVAQQPPSKRPLLVYQLALLLLAASLLTGWLALVWLAAHQQQQQHNHHTDASSLLESPRITPGDAQKNRLGDTTSLRTKVEAAPPLRTTQHEKKKVLTIYMESPSTAEGNTLPVRQPSAEKLQKAEFPEFEMDCSGSAMPLPVDNFPEKDPFLPWLHDYVTASDGSQVHFVAQNKRRCETGEGKDVVMAYWEPQISLLQTVPVRDLGNGTYRLTTPAEATAAETRFLCHFHDDAGHRSETTLSQFPFNYEYVLWRKNKLPMYQTKGPDVAIFELSQLLFSCPIPVTMKEAVTQGLVHLDLVPIRTPPRLDAPLFTVDQIGPIEWNRMQSDRKLFDAALQYGNQHILPPIVDSGRWANLPVCPPSTNNQANSRKLHYFVACTWTSASYRRRGDAVVINDSAARLKEWIIFHQIVGLDHIYVYDNTQLEIGEESPLCEIAESFADFVTYVAWPHSVCNNNRPNHKNPGERR